MNYSDLYYLIIELKGISRNVNKEVYIKDEELPYVYPFCASYSFRL